MTTPYPQNCKGKGIGGEVKKRRRAKLSLSLTLTGLGEGQETRESTASEKKIPYSLILGMRRGNKWRKNADGVSFDLIQFLKMSG